MEYLNNLNKEINLIIHDLSEEAISEKTIDKKIDGLIEHIEMSSLDVDKISKIKTKLFDLQQILKDKGYVDLHDKINDLFILALDPKNSHLGERDTAIESLPSEIVSNNEIKNIYKELKEIVKQDEGIASQFWDTHREQILNRLSSEIDKKQIDNISIKTLSKIRTLIIGLEQTEDEKIRNLIIKMNEIINANQGERTVNLYIACDLDAADANGVIYLGVAEAILGEIPVMTTASLLSRSQLMVNRDNVLTPDLFKKLDIYREKGGDFLVIIPKLMNAKLSDLDFIEEKFEKIKTFEETLVGSRALQPSSIEELTSLFTPIAKAKKTIFLNGHGCEGTIGALQAKNYRHLLKFLEHSQVQCLVINSCYGGSINTLKHYIKGKNKKKKTPSFPIVIRAIDSQPTYTYYDKDKFNQGIKRYFHGIETTSASSKNRHSVTAYGKMQRRADLVPVDLQNFSLMRFPTHGIENAFLPIAEDPDAFVLTNHLLQKERLGKDYHHPSLPDKNGISEAELAQLSEKNFPSFVEQMKREKKDPEIRLSNTKLLEIFPLVIDVPIKCEQVAKRVPIIHSMVVGNSHHFLRDIEIKNKVKNTPISFEAFIRAASQFYKENSNHKAFFIKNLSVDKKYTNVVMSFLDRHVVVLFILDGTYHMLRDGKDFEISAEEFASMAYQIAQDTTPREDVMKLAVGELGNDQDFMQTLLTEFWDGNPPKSRESDSILDLTSTDYRQETCLHRAIRQKNFIQIKQILQDEQLKIVVNKRNQNGLSPLVLAASLGHLEIAALLLDKINEMSPDQRKAIYPNLKEDLDKGLLQSGLNDHWEVFDAFLKKGGDINYTQNREINDISFKWTLMANLVKRKADPEKIKMLIQKGADIRAGFPSALNRAIYNTDLQTVKLLLDESAKKNGITVNTLISQQDEATGNVPLINTVLYDSYHAFRYLLEISDNLEAKNKNGETALLTALKHQRYEMSQMLLDKGADVHAKDNDEKNMLFYAYYHENDLSITQLEGLGLKLKEISTDNLNILLQTACKNENYGLIEKLLAAGANSCETVLNKESPFMEALNNNKEDLLKLFIKYKPQLAPSILGEIIQKEDWKTLKLAIESGLNPNTALTLKTNLLSEMYKTRQAELFKLLLEKGADPLHQENYNTFFQNEEYIDLILKYTSDLATKMNKDPYALEALEDYYPERLSDFLKLGVKPLA
jgi:ankyrin repeat protein